MNARSSVFVFMEYGRGLETWNRRYRNGEVSDPSPYGLGRVATRGVNVAFSSDRVESRPLRLFRKGAFKVLGFDLVHAWRNISRASNADVIWTHTEHVHFALSVIGLVRPVPPVVANSIWLADELPGAFALRRWFWRILLRRNRINITEAVPNAELLQEFIRKPVTPVFYGIDASAFKSHGVPSPDDNFNLLALGNDRHRDWDFFAALVRLLPPHIQVRVASKNFPDTANLPVNLQVVRATSVEEVRKLYEWANLVCLPLKANSHSSGVTVAMEATGAARPVLMTNVGGLEAYFPTMSEHMLPAPNATSAWLSRITLLSNSPELLQAMVEAATKDVQQRELHLDGYIDRLLRVSGLPQEI